QGSISMKSSIDKILAQVNLKPTLRLRNLVAVRMKLASLKLARSRLVKLLPNPPRLGAKEPGAGLPPLTSTETSATPTATYSSTPAEAPPLEPPVEPAQDAESA